MEIPTLCCSPTLPAFTIMFVTIYLFGYFAIFRDWMGKQRNEASSCLISIAHGTPAVLLSLYSILNSETQLSFTSPNSDFQNMVLEYSISYFFTDLLHYALFIPGDVLFIAHHLATLYVFLTCRYLVLHGGYALLVLLALAEITSVCQNTWNLAGFRRADSLAAAKLYGFLSPLFYAFYAVVRGFLGPVFVYKMGVFYLSGAADAVIPRWVWVSWMFVIGSAILVSVMWILNLWIDFFKNKRKSKDV